MQRIFGVKRQRRFKTLFLRGSEKGRAFSRSDLQENTWLSMPASLEMFNFLLVDWAWVL